MRTPTVLALVLLTACSPYVHSPPGRTFPLESAKTLNPGEAGIQVEGGGGVSVDVGLPGFTARARYGAAPKLDVSGEFGFVRVRPDGNSPTIESRPYLLSGRAGLKYAFIEHVAISGGLAAGGWAGGAFLSPDLSLILSYENPYIVPFVDFGGFTSSPFRTNDIEVVEPDPGDIDFIGSPVFTYGWSVGYGFRLPVMHDVGSRTAPAVLFGARFRQVTFEENVFQGETLGGRRKELYWLASVGFEWVFGTKRSRASATPRASLESSSDPRTGAARR